MVEPWGPASQQISAAPRRILSGRIRIARQGPDTSSYILALEQRTTSSRAVLFDREANVRASANQEFTQYSRSPAERGCVPSRPTRRGSTYWSRSAALSNGWVGQYHAPPRCRRCSGGHGPACDGRLRVHDHSTVGWGLSLPVSGTVDLL